MTQKESTLLKSLLAGGVIGTALGSLISKKKGSTTVGAIAGAAVLASAEAYKAAQKTDIPVLIEEDDVLYEVHADGTKKIIKKLPKSQTILRKNFILE